MTTYQVKLHNEFMEWSLPTKERNFPSMFEVADWWLAKMEEHDKLFRERVRDLKGRTYSGAVGTMKFGNESKEWNAALDAVLSLHERLEE